MASRFSLRVFLLCLLSPLSLALQVTPNSPCASTCIDSTTLDTSDPNSSNTRGADITCQDANYGSSTAGIKWQNCMSCLQNSTFSQGSENDQMWFLYNMRYSLSYCIFGYPNASNIQSSPCVTSFACEPLTNSLEAGILSPSKLDQYGYCSVDNSVLSHQTINRCSTCIAAGGETRYLANYLVALDAGCAQRPTPGHILGLNGSIFSRTAIGIVDPALLTPAATPSTSHGLSPTNIAVIIVAILLLLLIVSAFIFIRIKKRQNRRKRASYSTKYAAWGRSTPTQMPQSPMSFQCHGDENAADYSANGTPSLWNPHNAITSFQPISAVTESPNSSSQPQAGATNHQNPLQYHPLQTLNINTSTLPSYPPASHASPMSGSQSRFSPDSYTPTSAVSTRSTAPLLPYIPSQHVPSSALRGPHNISPPAAQTTAGSPSPLLKGLAVFARDTSRDSTASTLPPAPPPKSPRMVPGEQPKDGFVRVRIGGRRDKDGDRGQPVEMRKMGNVFPPPPPPRR